MPKIFLGNADTEAMVVCPQSLSKRYRQFSASASRRHFWMMSPRDLIILPSAGDLEHIRYVEEMCQYEHDSLQALYVCGQSDDPHPLSLDALKPDSFIQDVKKIGIEGHDWSIEPYIADQVAFDFGELVGMPVRFGASGTPAREAADLFNDKRVFRGLAAGLRVPVAPGRTCASPAQLVPALAELMPLTGSCIVKLDRHSGAEGNVLVTRDDITSAPGTHKVHHVPDQEYERVAQTVYSELSREQTPFLVVESYYRSVHSVGVHYLLQDDSVVFNGIADIRLAPAYAGMFWPTTLSDTVVHKLQAEGLKLAHDIARFGHRGPISVDAIVRQDGDILINEVNARHGGFTAAKAILERIVPKERGDALVAATRTNLTSDMDFRSLRALLARENLGFTRARGTGVVISVEDLRSTGRIEILTVAESRAELERIEERFVRLACR
ncbi:peptide ligase PGM1-related protein [Paraburkholderia sabiae]|uniref:Peptide ligase PGM1-related protein n=1 Tax=Paraburkholderia sabiae TaxID=273251 RepID=A0ABU9QL83_9BURK|nr:peptide ligase PGM1-related protein [Paraburkholderia sabiae]WJZ77374.1 peptide ligase PGM1-related protein [Paraburkholderia sabiae]CAD6547562.1 hypothetical protein LMG24235_04442 [Paraburkholderia sabiae]